MNLNLFCKGLSHDYPNGKNHPYDAVTNHWNWMKQFILEDSTTKANNSKIRVVTKIENVDHEYFIHIPANFDSTKQVPLVMFFMVARQDGNLYYNISGWNEVADTAHILMVYPSALSYCVVENGIQKCCPSGITGMNQPLRFVPIKL